MAPSNKQSSLNRGSRSQKKSARSRSGTNNEVTSPQRTKRAKKKRVVEPREPATLPTPRATFFF